jgi:hypothetical protein
MRRVLGRFGEALEGGGGRHHVGVRGLRQDADAAVLGERAGRPPMPVSCEPFSGPGIW